jgi:RES domain
MTDDRLYELLDHLTRLLTEGFARMPKGIPCLYCATTPKTAMSETRPWIGEFVCVARFRTLRDLNVVDCSYGTESSTLSDRVDAMDNHEK